MLLRNLSTRAFALGGFLVFAGLVALGVYLLSMPRWRTRLLMSVGLVSLGASTWVVCWQSSAPTEAPLESRFQSVYFGAARPARWTPVWLVNERDQVRLGSLVLPWIDSYSTPTLAVEYREAVESIYRELATDRQFNDHGSVLGEAYMDLLGVGTPLRHLYVYRPEGASRAPTIVVFHGFLGNIKAHAWIWRVVAQTTGCAVVLPTFRNGLWRGAEAQAMMDDVLRYIDAAKDLDSERIVVAGVSNGASGVTEWAKAHKDRFLGLLYVVPALEGTEDATGLPLAVGGRSILMLHGESDNRVPADFIRRCVILLQREGCSITRIAYPGQGHLLMFTAQEVFVRDVSNWIRTIMAQDTQDLY